MNGDSHLHELRKQMDRVNQQLAAALHERARLAREIGSYKRAHGIAAVDAVREQEMLAALLADLPEDGFSAAATERILQEVLEQSRLVVQTAAE